MKYEDLKQLAENEFWKITKKDYIEMAKEDT